MEKLPQERVENKKSKYKLNQKRKRVSFILGVISLIITCFFSFVNCLLIAKSEKKFTIILSIFSKSIITVIISTLILGSGMLIFSSLDSDETTKRVEAAQDYTVNKAGFAGGVGNEQNPYLIATAEQLNNVRNYSVVNNEVLLPGNYFLVIADIDLSEYLSEDSEGYNGGKGWEPIDIFESTFDGGGFTISGLWCDRSDENDVGLFGSATSSYIKNIRLHLADKGITGLTKCGGIVGSMDTSFGNKQSAKISNCSVIGSVTTALKHTADEIYFPSGYAGLIAGLIQHSEIEGCEATGNVTGLVYLGGIAGGVEYANVYNSIFRGEIISTAPEAWKIICAGGIAGVCFGDSILKNCFYYGVHGLNDRIAAIAGYNGWMGTFFSVQPLSPPEIYNCFYNADVVKSVVTYMEPDERWSEDCGIEGCDHMTCSGRDYQKYAIIENSRGLTTTEIKDLDNFTDWKFESIWGFDKDGNLVLRAFGNAYTPPSLTLLWITLGCLLGVGLLSTFIIVYKRKKPIYVTETITETVTIIESMPTKAIHLPMELTEREREIGHLILRGDNAETIAAELFISVGTVRNHIKSILRKSDCQSQRMFIVKYGNGHMVETEKYT